RAPGRARRADARRRPALCEAGRRTGDQIGMKAIFLLLALLPGFVVAQSFPSKPIKIVTGFAPGGAADATARIMAAKMSEGLAQQVIIENRTGAGALIAHDFVAKAPPDGHTLLLMAGGLPVQPALLKHLPH